ncbi:hypothetical protein CTAM01_13374 [Colletotrichum tamarilloi]|uniref:Secreted protein n=1 Tax=Colletotrichum tamarilloi TaxID=1209934 RepID=A0ABQ9QS75_9PEZI|nr:uncharacterized protein CTAM01_13374 [Colletotrichum tamarilloi]KAK1483494.1 hypothetical protein CTAM01_13374 [Colletotrichum tamarilloi]
MTPCFRLFVFPVFSPWYSILRTTSSCSSTPVYKGPRLYAVSVAKRQHRSRPRPRPRPISIPTRRVQRHVPWTTIDHGPVSNTIRARESERLLPTPYQTGICSFQPRFLVHPRVWTGCTAQ